MDANGRELGGRFANFIRFLIHAHWRSLSVSSLAAEEESREIQPNPTKSDQTAVFWWRREVRRRSWIAPGNSTKSREIRPNPTKPEYFGWGVR